MATTFKFEARDATGRTVKGTVSADSQSDVVADLILEMDSKLNVTTVTISHDMKVAFKIADRVAMLYQGQIIEQGTPFEFQQSQNPIVQQFIEGRAEGPLTDVASPVIPNRRRPGGAERG